MPREGAAERRRPGARTSVTSGRSRHTPPGRRGAGVRRSVRTPVGDDKPGPALPGKAYEFAFEARPGDRLTVTSMFGQSNDLFFAPSDAGIPLFERGVPLRGEITARFLLWDAGTEVNEEPGFGPDQAPRQAAPGTGRTERHPVRTIAGVEDGFTYPPVGGVVRVTITPGVQLPAGDAAPHTVRNAANPYQN